MEEWFAERKLYNIKMALEFPLQLRVHCERVTMGIELWDSISTSWTIMSDNRTNAIF